MIPPFWLAISVTVLTYTIGPILSGQHSTSIRPAIDQKAQELKDHAMNRASSMTDQTAAKAHELGSQATDTISTASKSAAAKAQHIKDRAGNMASSATNQTANKSEALGSRVTDTASSVRNDVVGKVQDVKDRTANANAQETQEQASAKSDSSMVGTTTLGNEGSTRYAVYQNNAPPTAPVFDYTASRDSRALASLPRV